MRCSQEYENMPYYDLFACARNFMSKWVSSMEDPTSSLYPKIIQVRFFIDTETHSRMTTSPSTKTTVENRLIMTRKTNIATLSNYTNTYILIPIGILFAQ